MSDAWRFAGFINHGVLVYIRGDSDRPLARAFAVATPDGVQITDIDSKLSRPERAALETTISVDLDTTFRRHRMGENGPTVRDWIDKVSGTPFNAVKTSRGRKPRWSMASLVDFVDDFFATGSQGGLSDSRFRQVMSMAAESGLVRIDRHGRRNVYHRTAFVPTVDLEVKPAFQERRAWDALNELVQAIESVSEAPPRSPRRG